ncbi:hypothetical protein FACS189429_2900 [Bacteroidia bacterium]|nr:hypothetical protein FACS189429_2900 [Bacteroidia bacterium]
MLYILFLFILIFTIIIIISVINIVVSFISKVVKEIATIFRGGERTAQKSRTNSNSNYGSYSQNKRIFGKNEGEYVDFEDVKK